MNKKRSFSTKTLVAIGLGAALFTLLFLYVKIPSAFPDTNIQIAYGISGFFGAVFGPVAGGLIAFIGHAITDAVSYGSVWWSWVIASFVASFITGMSFYRLRVEEGVFSMKDIVRFNIIQVIGNAFAWLLVAPGLDILIYAEPANKVFTQGAISLIVNAIATGVVGTILLIAYSKTKSKQGSLTKEN